MRQTSEFGNWLRKLRDREAKARIALRLRRMSLGNFGDTKPVGEGVWELRIPCGPGYRIYYLRKADVLVILLYGGDKSRQAADIERAKSMGKELQDEGEDNGLGRC